MYKFYYDSGCANMAIHAALEEIGARFDLVRVDLEKGDQHAPWYRQLHPYGRVPVLQCEHGTFYESVAILLYLCDRHPEAGLAPGPDSPQRPEFLQWLVHFTVAYQETMMHWFHPTFYGPASCSRDLAAFADAALDPMFARLDAKLAQTGPYMLGERFSACDFELAMIVYWSRHLTGKARAFPAINRCVDLVVRRPAYRRMMQKEGIVWPFDSAEQRDVQELEAAH